jgi:hypothetical protein
MKIRPMGAELFYADRKNGLTDKTKLLVASRNFANAPKKNTNVVKGTVAKGPAVEDSHCTFARVQNCCGHGKWHTALTLQITPLPSPNPPKLHTNISSILQPFATAIRAARTQLRYLPQQSHKQINQMGT